jgi:hypothetical protein
MASEVLSVPEEKLGEVIKVIRAGLMTLDMDVSDDTFENLTKWCDEEEEYLKRIGTKFAELDDATLLALAKGG